MDVDMEVRGTNINLDITLQRLAVIAYAASHWNEYNTAQFLLAHNRIGSEGSRTYIFAMVEEKEELFEGLNLPAKTSKEIIYVFKCLGERICLWYEYAQNILEIPFHMAKRVHWTVYGAIDEGKIVNTWLNSIDIEDENEVLVKSLYYMACSCVSIDYIKLHWYEMLWFCEIYSRDHLSLLQDPSEMELKYIICSVLFLADVKSEELSNLKTVQTYFNDLHRYSNQEAYMFSLSVEEARPIAVRYYWNLLGSEEKNENILPGASVCVDEFDREHDYFITRRRPENCDPTDRDPSFMGYRNQCLADLLPFFLSRMSEEHIVRFLNTKINAPSYGNFKHIDLDVVLDMLMWHWPWEELFFQAIDAIQKYCNSQDEDYYDLLKKTLLVINRNNGFGLYNKMSVHRRMFFAVWEQFKTYSEGEDFSSKIVKLFSPNKNLSSLLFRVFDLDILDLVINIQHQPQFREEIIQKGEKMYKELIGNGRYEILEDFMEVVLKSDDERKWFKYGYLNFYGDFISDNRLDVVDELLDWKSSTKEQRMELKHGIDFMSICAHLFCHNKIQLAGKVLKWRFVNEDEKKHFINIYEPNEQDWLHVIWRLKKDCFIDRLSNFLIWFLDSEEEINRFKAKKLITQKTLRNFIDILFKSKKSFYNKDEMFQTVDELLNFCFETPKKVTSLKDKIREKINGWIIFLSNGNCLDLVDYFLDWVFSNEEEKRKAVKTFLLSPDGLKFLDDITKDCWSWSKCTPKRVSLWIEMTVNFVKLEDLVFDEASTSKQQSASPGDRRLSEFRDIIDALKNAVDLPSRDNKCAVFKKKKR